MTSPESPAYASKSQAKQALNHLRPRPVIGEDREARATVYVRSADELANVAQALGERGLKAAAIILIGTLQIPDTPDGDY